MKKLLSMLAVSALVGTSASTLKPMFTSNVSQGFKSNQERNKDISITNENNTNPFDFAKINQISNIEDIVFSVNGETMFVSTSDGVYKSTDDGINFSIIKGIPNITVTKLITDKKNNIFASDREGNIYKSNGTDEFKIISGTSGSIKYLITDQYDNIYAGNGNGIIYKSNGTDEFTEITKLNGAITCLAVDKNKSGIIFASTAAGYDDGYVYKSTDGNTFIPMSGTSSAIWSLAIDKNGIIFAGNGNGIVYKSTDGNTFIPMSGTSEIIRILIIDNDNNVYAGAQILSRETGTIYKSNGTDEFTKINTFNNIGGLVWTLAINNKNNDIYSGIYRGLYKTNPINLLLNVNKPDTFDNSWTKYKGIVYNSVQKIDIKANLVARAKLDNKNITIPTTDLELTNGQHTLVLTLKDEYKQSAILFGGDNNGQVTYKLWVKTSIDKKDINYSTNTDDTYLTDLSLGFVSTTGNTINCPIIQTKSKDGSVHNAPLNISYDDALLDYSNSYYVQGTVDDTTNDFTATGTKQSLNSSTTIATDGTYHLHLVDTVGNTYDSYLELGKDNWKLKGTFNYEELNKLKTELNVEVDLTDPKQLARATGWLKNYEQIVSDLFEKSLKANGKGFDSEIKNELENDFKWFLKPLTYDIANEPKFDDGIDKDKLDKTIRDTAEKCLQDGLTNLPQNLNIDFKNVTDKQTLDNCKIWSNNYEKYIKDNVSKWITDISNVASRGFATSEQTDKIKTYINSLPFNNYLQKVEWTDTTNNDYQKFVDLDKLQSDTIDWVNQNMPEINQAYQNAIKVAESGLNLHGYSIEKLLNGKSIPQTKSEIDNFVDGQSFHNWLQSQANIKFHGWQLAMGLGIGIPLFLIATGIAWFVRKATDPRYNPFARGRKEQKVDDNIQKKNLKEIKTNKNDE